MLNDAGPRSIAGAFVGTFGYRYDSCLVRRTTATHFPDRCADRACDGIANTEFNMKLRTLLLALPALAPLWAQTVDPNLYSNIRWRLIGPFRGGKATMVSGVSGSPAIYYMGTAGSGVWKTVDGGQVGRASVTPSALPESARWRWRRRGPIPCTWARRRQIPRGPISLQRRRRPLGSGVSARGTV